MKSPRKPRIVEAQSAAAAVLRCPLAEIRRAKLAGCPSFRAGGRINVDTLRSWLKRHPRKQSKVVVPAAAQDDTGAASALKRLEVEEGKAYRKLQEAIGTDDEPVARSWWLRCSEQLRKHDLAVEASRRDAGDLLPRSECERVVEGFTATLGIHWRGAIENVCPRLAGVTTPAGMLAILDPIVAAALDGAANALRTRPWRGSAFPEWVTVAMQRGIDAHL